MSSEIIFRHPVLEDGIDVFDLIERCPPLDQNSSYCNFLQCSHFADTCVAAEMDGDLVGFVSGYRLPSDSSILFVWQVAVDSRARGQGLASKMIMHLLSQPSCRNVTHVHTTITEANEASWALFRGLAAKLDCGLASKKLMDQERHFKGRHDSEFLVHLGPFASAS
tara:strand:+ start:1511 stop:2008 length:498 start_codon:yes stop_codon:yes gene_type:complete